MSSLASRRDGVHPSDRMQKKRGMPTEEDNPYRFQLAIERILKKLEVKGTGARQFRLIFMLDQCAVLNDVMLGLRAKSKIRIIHNIYAQNGHRQVASGSRKSNVYAVLLSSRKIDSAVALSASV